MQAGKLNRRVSIQVPSTTKDAFGGVTATWTTGYTCWAHIDIQQSALVYSTAEFVNRVIYRITVRWTSSFIFKGEQRIVYVEPTTQVQHSYLIQAILNTKNANRELVLLCYEQNGEE